MKNLVSIRYPKDFVCPKMKPLSDRDINKLIKLLPLSEDEFVETGNTLVLMASTGHIEVFLCIAECEVKVPW